MTALQNFVDGIGLGISKEKLVHYAYRFMVADGHDCCVLNEKYIIVDGKDYQFIKSKKQGRWIVKGF